MYELGNLGSKTIGNWGQSAFLYESKATYVRFAYTGGQVSETPTRLLPVTIMHANLNRGNASSSNFGVVFYFVFKHYTPAQKVLIR